MHTYSNDQQGFVMISTIGDMQFACNNDVFVADHLHSQGLLGELTCFLGPPIEKQD